MERRTNERTDRETDKLTDGRMDERNDGRTEGQTNERMDEDEKKIYLKTFPARTINCLCSKRTTDERLTDL